MKTAIYKWLDEQENRKDVEEAVKRTMLQIGIFKDVMLDYRPGRTRVDSSRSGSFVQNDYNEGGQLSYE
ncbi:hypothetical protein J6TS1_20580 [Siminovitchia terrae]|uniref:Uncharacterized protein n=1 Tax=Siminovitchia terrae TaxID=1914933 RepID=A0A429X5E9_SIMTE|nr:DUF6138 family protein [Siminovitchia terrae]RST58655.1 hypothetical protein D5F11_016640 [Siminovitchia terrae]GIN92678.1 hypothetical protein J22TS1_37290 [Siminovitchia terrae]GIN96188.1 hypothetical protein J6TS1_20580 [Siminovitchia terrae]